MNIVIFNSAVAVLCAITGIAMWMVSWRKLAYLNFVCAAANFIGAIAGLVRLALQ
jgi:hypothetical protein